MTFTHILGKHVRRTTDWGFAIKRAELANN